MKILLKILGFLVLLVVLLIAIGFTLPSKFLVERSVVINAPAEKIYPFVADVKRWPEWQIWHERDPKMQVTTSPTTNEIGSTSTWKSPSQGNGSAKLTKLEPSKRVEFELAFEGFDQPSLGVVLFEPAGGATKVRWQMSGDVGSSPINRWFCKFMDGLVGKDFDAGLAKLKTAAEK